MTKERLAEEMKEEMEKRGVVLVQKGDWQVWWHWLIPALFWVWGKVNHPIKELFYTRFWTALGRHFYVPDLAKVTLRLEGYIPLIFHEMMHVDDDAERPIWYKVSYVLSRWWRAHWEYRATAWEFAALYALEGAITDRYIEGRARNFTSAMYVYMDKNPSPVLYYLRTCVREGRLSVEDMAELSRVLEEAYARRKLGLKSLS